MQASDIMIHSDDQLKELGYIQSLGSCPRTGRLLRKSHFGRFFLLIFVKYNPYSPQMTEKMTQNGPPSLRCLFSDSLLERLYHNHNQNNNRQ